MSAIDNMASHPHAIARPSETSWFIRYERFFLKPQMLLSATSSGRKIPVEVISSMTTERIWPRPRTLARNCRLRMTKSLLLGR